jgi:hypothetical protein
MEEFEIFDISEFEEDIFEQLGSKQKFWYQDDGRLYLFKATKSKNREGELLDRAGEDWSEKIACEIATALQLPCAKYELAIFNGQPGVICETVLIDGEELIHGNQLTSEFEEVSVTHDMAKEVSHSVQRVAETLRDIVQKKPKNWDSLHYIKNATDVFIGYLMLDTLISNQDRHDENWGGVRTLDDTYHLAPTFDHAASLGRNESDEKRRDKLESKDRGRSVENYVLKAKSFITDAKGKRLKTIEAFTLLGDYSPKAMGSWLNILCRLEDYRIQEIVNKVPEKIMTHTSKEFTLKIILANKKRLLKLRRL